MSNKPLRGVNLGGWLVLEKWITPSLFSSTSAEDEYSYCQHADSLGLQRLKHFRDTFIIKDDFVWLAEHGIQAIRLPVGYWIFGGKPYMQTVHYVDNAFEWAEETGIRILLDVHGVLGSQNGKFHSGKTGIAGWVQEDVDGQGTLKVIRKLALRYGKSRTLLGISLLNEPSPDLSKEFVLDFYEKAYRTIRDICGKEAWVVYSQGFRSYKWRKVLRGYDNLLIDYHHYQNFRFIDHWLPARWQVWRARWQLPLKLWWLSRYHALVVGEWSLTYSARNKSRVGKDKANTLSRGYARAQLQAFNKTAADFYWTYKTEYPGSWSFRDCVLTGSLDVACYSKNSSKEG